MLNGFRIVQNIPEHLIPEAAAIYFEAFEAKLGGLLKRDGTAERFFTSIMKPEFAVFAVSEDKEKVLGVAGFKTPEGAFTEGMLRDIFWHYGVFGGSWRAMVMSVLERKVRPGELLMDGIAVHADARGKGVGTALLEAIFDKARELGLSSVRLDVIDANSRARALYERRGFVAGKEQSTGLFRHVFGFSSYTEMIKTLEK